MRPVLLGLALLGCAPRSGPGDDAIAPALVNPANGDPRSQTQLVGELQLVATREGRIELALVADQAFALIDGEPIPLRPGGSVTRDPALGLGLLPDKPSFAATHELVAFAGDWLVYAEHATNAGSTSFSYARTADGWVAQPRRRRSNTGSEQVWIETDYASIVESGGSLLGLRRARIHSDVWDWGDEPDPAVRAQLEAIGRELGEAPHGFDRLSGERPVPAMPDGWNASEAVATTSGQIVALGFRPKRRLDEDEGPARALEWAPGEVTATVTELPGLVDPAVRELGIWAAGEAVLIGGLHKRAGADDAAWLAIREDEGSFREVPLELPIPVRERVASATVTPDGELWIVTGGWNFASTTACPCLWKKPIDGAWRAVELEPVMLARDAEARWAHVWAEQSWIEIPAGTPTPRWPAAREVVAAGGAIWVTAELGPSYPTADSVLADPRMALFSSVAVAQERELIATDQLFDERVDRLAAASSPTPGSDACRTFTLVLADGLARDGEAVDPSLVERLRGLAEVATIEDEDRWASASVVYVGALDGVAQLVAEANAWDPGSALALAEAFARVLGHRPTLDCRPRAMLRVIEQLR